MIRIIISGAAGRMGGRIATLVSQTDDMKLVGAVDRKGHPSRGRDAGELLGAGRLNVILNESYDDIKETADVIIDFSTPEGSINAVNFASGRGIPAVIGTTGHNTEQVNEIKKISNKIPCVFAPNMSVGINVMFKVIKDISEILGKEYDVEILEIHHRLKKDSPSGTALKIANIVADVMKKDLDEVGIYARLGIIGERKTDEIGIQALRAGDIVGEHTVIFGGLGERIEIIHRAHSRDNFAKGAIRAVRWIIDKKPGLYDMQDVLGLRR